MKTAILGGGMVGQTLGGRLAANGHDVSIGVRIPDYDTLSKARTYADTPEDWTAQTVGRVAGFAEAAEAGEIVFNATSCLVSPDALTAAGARNLSGEVLVDVSTRSIFPKACRRFSPPRPARAPASAPKSTRRCPRHRWSRRSTRFQRR